MKSLKILSIAALTLLVIACSKVTEDNFQKINSGMSYDDVHNLLGEADVLESTSLAGISTSKAEWKGKDGTISIRFIEQKVRAKNWQPPQE